MSRTIARTIGPTLPTFAIASQSQAFTTISFSAHAGEAMKARAAALADAPRLVPMGRQQRGAPPVTRQEWGRPRFRSQAWPRLRRLQRGYLRSSAELLLPREVVEADQAQKPSGGHKWYGALDLAPSSNQPARASPLRQPEMPDAFQRDNKHRKIISKLHLRQPNLTSFDNFQKFTTVWTANCS